MEYEKCLVELDEVLNYLVEEDLQKIPIDIRQAIKEKKDKKYSWNYDPSKELSDQNLNRQTIAMLSYLNMEYLLNPEQKALMEQIHRVNEENLEKEKSEKYPSDIIFKKDVIEDTETKEVALVKCTHEKWYKKIFLKIKNIFRRNNG